jgi:RNA polymerase sigma-70 factor (ECF subfamily)
MRQDDAFAELRPAMLALAYRITGSRSDAEDIVQDAYLRLRSASPKEAVRSLKAYLATITARLSLNRLRDAKARRDTYPGEWLPEPVATEGDLSFAAADMSFALLVLLERLSPAERVVFVLRNAFELSFAEIADVVARDPTACRKLFSRARERVLAERPRFTVDRERHRNMMQGFVEAVRAADLQKLVSLLDDAAVLRGDGAGRPPANKKPVVGAEAVARFVIAVTRMLPPQVELDEVELNGAPAIFISGGGRPIVAIMIETDGERILSVFAVANPEKLSAIATSRAGSETR